MSDYETIKRRHSHALRGMKEVKTDKAGRELINEALKSFNLIVEIQEKHISQIELDNEQMMLELDKQTIIRAEFIAMKLCLFNTVALDEMEDKLI